MDQLQAYLATQLPPSLLSHLTTHSTTYYKIYQQLKSFQSLVINRIVSPILSTTTSNPDATSLIILLAVLFVSLALLRMLYRTIVWWISMVFRLAVLVVVLGIGAWVLNRGVDGAWVDLNHIGEIWKREYERYDAMGRQGQGYGRTHNNRWL